MEINNNCANYVELAVKEGFLSMDQLSPLVLSWKPLESVSCLPVLFFQSTHRDNTEPVKLVKQ